MAIPDTSFWRKNDTLMRLMPLLLAIVSGFVFIFSSCTSKAKTEVAGEITDAKLLPTLYTYDVETLISDSGITRYRVKAKEWLMFEAAAEPYWYFPKGLYVEQFDSTYHTESFIVGDTAYYYKDKKLWKLVGNVRMENIKNEIFETQLLFWDQNRREMYTDSNVYIQRDDKIIRARNFVSNESMTRYLFKGAYDSSFPIKQESRTSDSTNVAISADERSNAQRYAPRRKGGGE